MQNLKGKRILVTAGSTWVPIDKVRVITSVFGGNLGIKIAETFAKAGSHVDLVIGPGRVVLPKINSRVKVLPFKYYRELLKFVKENLVSNKYDVMVHSAAVADYEPIEVPNDKIKSGKRELIIKFKPTIKIVDLVKELSPEIFLVKFKLEVGLVKEKLIKMAYKSMKESRADLMVANEFSETGPNHRAYIIDEVKNFKECVGKEMIAERLVALIKEKLE